MVARIVYSNIPSKSGLLFSKPFKRGKYAFGLSKNSKLKSC